MNIAHGTLYLISFSLSILQITVHLLLLRFVALCNSVRVLHTGGRREMTFEQIELW